MFSQRKERQHFIITTEKNIQFLLITSSEKDDFLGALWESRDSSVEKTGFDAGGRRNPQDVKSLFDCKVAQMKGFHDSNDCFFFLQRLKKQIFHCICDTEVGPQIIGTMFTMVETHFLYGSDHFNPTKCA